MNGGSGQRPVPSLRSYLLTWAGLLALLALTLGTALLPLGGLSLAINLAISVTQAVLAVMAFMQLRAELVVVRLAAAAGFLFLGFMVILMLTDYLTR
jgi:cytochrome c oxidase subunit 4